MSELWSPRKRWPKINSYHDTCISRLRICWYDFFRWPLTWPRYRSKVRKTFKMLFRPQFCEKFLPNWYQRISIPRPHRTYARDKRFDLFSLGHVDLKVVCQVTFHWEPRISPVSLYILAGFGPYMLKNQVPIIISCFSRLYLWPMWPLGSHVSSLNFHYSLSSCHNEMKGMGSTVPLHSTSSSNCNRRNSS